MENANGNTFPLHIASKQRRKHKFTQSKDVVLGKKHHNKPIKQHFCPQYSELLKNLEGLNIKLIVDVLPPSGDFHAFGMYHYETRGGGSPKTAAETLKICK